MNLKAKMISYFKRSWKRNKVKWRTVVFQIDWQLCRMTEESEEVCWCPWHKNETVNLPCYSTSCMNHTFSTCKTHVNQTTITWSIQIPQSNWSCQAIHIEKTHCHRNTKGSFSIDEGCIRTRCFLMIQHTSNEAFLAICWKLEGMNWSESWCEMMIQCHILSSTKSIHATWRCEEEWWWRFRWWCWIVLFIYIFYFMRSQESQSTLDSMSKKQKFERTTRQSFTERWTLLQVFDNWYITKNEFPHQDRWSDQLVLWKKNTVWNEVQHIQSYSELESILREYWLQWYTIIMHSLKDQSVPFRTHFHLYR